MKKATPQYRWSLFSYQQSLSVNHLFPNIYDKRILFFQTLIYRFANFRSNIQRTDFTIIARWIYTIG